jgi:hypothetical protein
MNRNSKKVVNQDIKFLEEMLLNLKEAYTDKVPKDHLKRMIDDWKSELESLLKT